MEPKKNKHQCPRCKEIFRDSWNLNRHLQNKNPCVLMDDSKKVNESSLESDNLEKKVTSLVQELLEKNEKLVHEKLVNENEELKIINEELKKENEILVNKTENISIKVYTPDNYDHSIKNIMEVVPKVGGYVYFIQRIDTGNIKIGKTKNLKQRMSTLNTSNDMPLHFKKVFELEKYSELEKYFHYLFRDHRIHGEWFDLSEFYLEIIYRIIEDDFINFINNRECFGNFRFLCRLYGNKEFCPSPIEKGSYEYFRHLDAVDKMKKKFLQTGEIE